MSASGMKRIAFAVVAAGLAVCVLLYVTRRTTDATEVGPRVATQDLRLVWSVDGLPVDGSLAFPAGRTTTLGAVIVGDVLLKDSKPVIVEIVRRRPDGSEIVVGACDDRLESTGDGLVFAIEIKAPDEPGVYHVKVFSSRGGRWGPIAEREVVVE